MLEIQSTNPVLGAKPAARQRFTGEVVYLYAFDVAFEMRSHAGLTLLGQPVHPFTIDSGKRTPRFQGFFQPSMARFPVETRQGPGGPVPMRFSVKLFPVGAISLMARVPFHAEALEDLVGFHDLALERGLIHDEIRRLATQICEELQPYLIGPAKQLPEEEAYTVFCLNTMPPGPDGTFKPAEVWYLENRLAIAGLLTQELNPADLSRQESEESTSRILSYYQQDLVVIDWDAALVMDEPEDFDQALYVMELANVQLAELEAYDKLLDDAMERGYREVAQTAWRRRQLGMRELRELRIDMIRFYDAIGNITKFFGDWHLARIYEHLSARFHLPDWRRVIDEKLKTLDDLYQILNHDQSNRWMLVLEATIVLLFIIDLVILFIGLK